METYRIQCGQFTDYVCIRREALVDQWLAKCSNDEAQYGRTGTAQPDTALFQTLLDGFIQRLGGMPEAGDWVARAGQYSFQQQQRGYTLVGLLRELNNGYDVFEVVIQQFLVLYPRTKAQVINQAYNQLRRFLNEVTTSWGQSVDQAPQNTAIEQVQTRQPPLVNPHHPLNYWVDQLPQTVHDLRTSLGIISGAASVLNLALNEADQAKYKDMIRRNVATAVSLVDQLLEPARGAESKKLG